MDESILEAKEIKDALLAKKQGEALERCTYPMNMAEALGLGDFQPICNVTLNAINMAEDLINEITGLKTTPLHKFTYGVSVASGSKSGKRLEGGFTTIGQLGQYIPGFPGIERPTPMIMPAPIPDKDRKKK